MQGPIQEMGRNLDRLYNQANDCRTTLKRWNYQTFSIDDLRYTTKTYEEILKEFNDFKSEFEELHEYAFIINQPIQTLKEIISSFKVQEINPEKHLADNKDKMEKEFNRLRIKSVQYRNQPIKVLKKMESGIQIQVGFDSLKDTPVEVWVIPKRMWRQDLCCEALLTFEAHHELLLSKHFPRYMGQNLNDEDNYLHFMELTRGHTLRYLVKNQKTKITPDCAFFRTVMRQVLQGLYDILTMTRYQPVLPLTLMNIQVANEGVKVYLKNVSFTSLKSEDQDLEAALLKNFAQIVISTLGIDRTQMNKLNDHIAWKLLLEGLFDAEDDAALFKKNTIQTKLHFSQLLHHDLFHEELIAHFEITDIIKNYHELFMQIN